ncbi:MAG: NERD domain-containing protein [Akkermansiaceae bacterium]|nr:NERD domain-containing protein [Akkermansiaceae bacterium]
MKMIPSSPYGTSSKAEKRIFDRLRQAYEVPREDWTCFHSLNLTRHPSKRFGEADFVLCGPKGVFILEIKGGGIACNEGQWATTDRNGVISNLKESPFVQAETALHAIQNRMRENMPIVHNQLTFGYGVIFPDCNFDVSSLEWENCMVADAKSSRDIVGWLNRLFKHWHGKVNRPNLLDSKTLKDIRAFLRPNFDTAIPLHVIADDIEEKATSLTADQMRAIDIIEANNRILCYGGAGTGKTFLAMELARRWTSEGQQVALICRSPWLRQYLETKAQIPNLTLALASNVKSAARRAGIDSFDRYIIDEGQDIFESTVLDNLEPSLNGGWSEGKWCIFYDVNNQAGLFGPTDLDTEAYLESFGAAKVPLTTNCRNTKLILDKVKNDLGADMGVRGAGNGPQIREFQANSPEESATLLANELKEIINIGGISEGNVTILSPLPFPESSAALLHATYLNRIEVIDEYSLRSFPPSHISFATIKEFKGLENEAVILIDLPTLKIPANDLNLRYVGMSRARAVLSIISTITTQSTS